MDALILHHLSLLQLFPKIFFQQPAQSRQESSINHSMISLTICFFQLKNIWFEFDAIFRNALTRIVVMQPGGRTGAYMHRRISSD
mmetsp:Transcript_45832/g.90275  ORF Transcript_45832/g.90275 Transcript_45832/m.90275 type:complete len:85 (+) Transcript_45832:465-719(+)